MDFMQILMKIKSSHQDDSDLLEAFEVFDREKKGFFRLHELEDTFTKIPGSDPVTECELAEILQLADPDGDGRVHFEGLCEVNKTCKLPIREGSTQPGMPVGTVRRAMPPMHLKGDRNGGGKK